MEWAKETAKETAQTATDTAKTATDAVVGGDSNGTSQSTYEATKDTANEAYDAAANPSDTASTAYDNASEYVPDVTDGKTTSAALLNSAPFRSFKPDPSTVWKGHLIYLLLAAGCTLPWWAFVCAVDYFQFLYPGWHIIRLFTFAYYGPWLVAYVLVAGFWREGSSWVKINAGLAVSVVVLAVIALMNGVFLGSKGSTATFWVTLCLVAIAGCADAVSQGSLLGVSSELPRSFGKAYSDGAVASGVFVFILRLITKAALSSSEKGLRISGIVYFSVAALFPVLVISLFAYVHYMPEMSYYNSLNLGSLDTVRLLIQDEDNVTIEVASGAAIASVAAGRTAPTQPLQWTTVLNKIKTLATATFITSVVTLSIFPGVLAEDAPHLSQLGDYSPLLLLGTFIIFDLLGRLITASAMTERQSTLFGSAWSRLILVGLFVLALLFDSSFLMLMVLTALLGITNGFLIVTLTVVVPKANSSDMAETAGILNALVMNAGVLVGAALSWIWILV